MTPDRLIEILQLGESQAVEFKSHSRPDIIGKNVCALLNAQGGYVVCGVREGEEVAGIETADAARVLESKLAEGLVPKALVSVGTQDVEGKTVLVVEVPAGKDVPYAFRDRVYVREGGQTVKADIETIKDMVLRRQAEPERWERRFSSADMETDVDRDEVAATVKAAERNARMQFHDDSDIQGVLQDLAVARYGRLTNAGDVLFTRTPELRNPQVRVRAVSFTSDRTDDTYRDQKSLSGPLVQVLEEVYRFIVRNTPTLAHFRRDELARENAPLFPPEAVREGLVNAFAHRDYADYKGGVAVHVYPQRLEIWNSGSLPEGVTPEKLAKGHISVLRNPDIAHVLYLRGMMEKVGRGSLLVLNACRQRDLPPPVWSTDALGVTLTFYAPEGSARTGEAAAQVTAEAPAPPASTRQVPGKHPATGPQGTGKEAHEEAHEAHEEAHEPMTDTEQVILRACSRQPSSTQELLSVLGYDSRTGNFKRALTHLLEAGHIEMTLPSKPRSKKQKYRLTTKGKAEIGRMNAEEDKAGRGNRKDER